MNDTGAMAQSSEPGEGSHSGPQKSERFKRRAILLGVGLVVAALAWWMGVSMVPRWWAQRVGNVVDGRLFVGSIFGIAVGFFFTMGTFTILWFGWRFRASWRRGVLFVIVAVLVSAPNLATLGIVMGNSNAAHAGERILDVDGVGFRGGSVVGLFLAVVLASIVVWLTRSRKLLKERAAGHPAESKKGK